MTHTPHIQDQRPVLDIQNLKTYFFLEKVTVRALDGVNLKLLPGATLGVVGESGCGKSIMAMSVMRLIQQPPGKIVEMAETNTLLHDPLYPYTEALLSAIPPADPDIQPNRIRLTGEVPSPANPPPGCIFHPRCNYCQAVCKVDEPQLHEINPGHYASCHFAKELSLRGIGGPA
ncbi:MAG TPA: ABC transporter ATP-binding protein [Levilinea sp.]|nr:ABC transporter ATP-binding protein [Levilinea sp.]